MLYLGAKKSLLSSGKTLAQQVAAMFASGEQGAWYEPSLSNGTLYQDSAGTTPVTAVGQPVGLMLDKRLGLVRGVNLIPEPEGDGTSANNWAATAATITAAGGEFLVTTSAANHNVRYGVPTIPGKTYEYTWTSRLGTMTALMFSVYNNTALADIIPKTTYTPGTNRAVFTAPTGCILTSVYLVRDSNNTGTAYFDNISVRELPGNHATQPTAINRPVLQQDGNGKYYLAFNGTNSWMSTGSIDFTGTDKMTVVAGVRKLSDAAQGFLIESSTDANSNNGAFQVRAPAVGAGYAFGVRGTVAGELYATATNYPAPISSVLACSFNTAGPTAGTQLQARMNGAQVSLPTAAIAGPTTAGNYGNYPLYLGARAGTSLFFNGQLYSLIIRGAASTDAQIIAAECFANSKTGAY